MKIEIYFYSGKLIKYKKNDIADINLFNSYRLQYNIVTYKYQQHFGKVVL